MSRLLLIWVLAVLDPSPDAPDPSTLSLAESRELNLDLGPEVDLRQEESQIYHAAVDAEKTASHSEIDETKVWTSIFKHCFQQVICDEGHKLNIIFRIFHVLTP